jgi:hypothetical protein
VPPEDPATAASLAGRQVAALVRLATEDLSTARVLITVTEHANAGFGQLNHSHTCFSANGATHKDRDGQWGDLSQPVMTHARADRIGRYERHRGQKAAFESRSERRECACS